MEVRIYSTINLITLILHLKKQKRIYHSNMFLSKTFLLKKSNNKKSSKNNKKKKNLFKRDNMKVRNNNIKNKYYNINQNNTFI